MRGLVVALLVCLQAGCIEVRDPSLSVAPMPTIRIEAVAEDFLGCVAADEEWSWDRPAQQGVCHVAKLRLAIPPTGSRLVSTEVGWTAVSEHGNVHPGRLLAGRGSAVPGTSPVLRVGFAVEDGGRLVEVRWTDAADLTVTAPVGAYLDLSSLGPPTGLRRAERSHFDCERVGGWPCIVATLEVDNTAGTVPFPGPDTDWVGRQTDLRGGKIPLVAAQVVDAGAVGDVRLVLPFYFPSLRVGFRTDGWTVPAFDLPETDSLPFADAGSRMDRLTAEAVSGPAPEEDGLLYMWATTSPTTSDGACTPFNGMLHDELHWQPGTLALDSLWQERAAGWGPVTPADLDPDEPSCTFLHGIGLQEEDMDGVYRWRFRATVDATGAEFRDELYFYT